MCIGMPRSTRWNVHKFGGTSVGSADCMRKCVDIIKPLLDRSRVAVVVSAMGGKPKTTDMLLQAVHAAAARDEKGSNEWLDKIMMKHTECVNDILANNRMAGESILAKIASDLNDIRDLLRAVSLMRVAHENILELVSGYGEIWSATLMTEIMKGQGLDFVFVNARDVLFITESEGTNIHWEISETKLQEYLAKCTSGKSTDADGNPRLPHLMITGYIASTLDGGATTLKRDGSDFSASIFGKLLKADNITIWTDVSGVYSADPRKVPEAQIISEVSYSEAIELAYFGAKVIHPKTMFPAISDKIPIFIRNTFEADHPGTRIYLPPAKGETAREMCVCGFTTMDNISLINVEGTGMRGVPGIASRLFSALKTINVSVLFIAQSSSENSICFALKDIYSAQAVKTLEETFFFELKEGSITGIKEIMGCSIIAAIGDGMSNVPGVSGIFFGALGTAKVNILSVAQGCDERNISAVVDTSQAAKALRAVHAAFWLSSLDLSVALIGTGRVGSAIIQMLINQVRIMEDRFGIKINIRAVANSKKMILSKDLTPDLKAKLRTFFSFLRSPTASRKGSDVENGGLSNTSSMSQIHLSRSLSSSSSSLNAMSSIKKSHSNVSLSDVQDMMACEDDEKMSATDMKVLLDHVVGGDNSNTVIIDATNSNSIAALHPTWLQRGAHVVTANKRGIANGLELYNEIMKSAGLQKRMYLSEVTIGASLPIRTTLHDILHSGDAVHQIVGLMSVSAGTVITEMTENGLSFTQAIEKTYSTGLFEDDVFEDLAGVEVAQKLLVLARELGAPMALDDIEIEPLAKRREVKNWASLGDTFKEEDAMWAKRVADAKSRGCCLRYVQRIQCVPPVELGNADDGIDSDVPTITACVRLEEVPEHSMYGLVKGPVYYFAFHTERYMQYPLVVQGPLSDSANTASGIVGDILRLAKSLGAKDKGPAAAIRRMSF